MSVKIFDSISLEDIECKLANESVDKIDLNIDPYLRGIEFGIEQLSVLSKIKKILLKNSNKPYSKATKKLTSIAYENNIAKLNLSEINSLAFEDLNNSEYLNLTVESISYHLKEIWKSILETIKYIWKKIKSFFTITVSERKKNRKNNENQLNDILKDLDRLDIKPSKNVLIDNENILLAFKYIGKNISQNDLLNLIKEVNSTSQYVRNIISEIQEVTLFSNKYITDCVGNGDEGIKKLIDSVKVENNYPIFNIFNNYAQGIAVINKNPEPHLLKLKEKINEGVIKTETTKIIPGFIHGGAIAIYSLSDINQNNYTIDLIDECQEDSNSITIVVPEPDIALEYTEQLMSIEKELDDIEVLFKNKIYPLDYIFEKNLMLMGNAISSVKESDEDTRNKLTFTMRFINSYLMKLNNSAIGIMNMYSKTVYQHRLVSNYIIDYYGKCLKEKNNV